MPLDHQWTTNGGGDVGGGDGGDVGGGDVGDVGGGDGGGGGDVGGGDVGKKCSAAPRYKGSGAPHYTTSTATVILL